MRDEDALLRAIDHEPHDDLPRLAYADWLEENGDADRAEFIRIQCRLAELSPLDADRVPLAVRETELLGKHEADWIRRARGSSLAAVIAGFERGFPLVRVRADEKASLKEVPPGPLGGLDVTVANPLIERGFWRSGRLGRAASLTVSGLRRDSQAEAVAECPHLSRLRSLELYPGRGDQGGPWDRGLAALAASPHLADLRRFALHDNNTITAAGLATMAGATWAKGVRHLGLDLPGLTGAGIEPIARSGAFEQLESLDLTWDDRNRTAYTLFEIVESQVLPQLRFLRFSGGMGENEIQMIADSDALGRIRGISLTHLVLNRSVLALARSPHAGQIGYLDLPHTFLAPDAVRALARSERLTSLRVLTLTNNAISDAGAMEIAAGAAMARLTALSLNKTGLGDPGVRTLAGSPRLGELQRLDLSDNDVSDVGVRALADSRTLRSLRLLYLAGNHRITDHGFEMLSKSPNLRLVNDPRRIPKPTVEPPPEPAEPEDEWE